MSSSLVRSDWYGETSSPPNLLWPPLRWKTESNCRLFAGVEDDESIGCLEINQIFHPLTLTGHDCRSNTKLIRIEQFPSIHSSKTGCFQQVIKHSSFEWAFMGCQLPLSNQVVSNAVKRRTKCPIDGMNQQTKSLGWVMWREVLPAKVYSLEE